MIVGCDTRSTIVVLYETTHVCCDGSDDRYRV